MYSINYSLFFSMFFLPQTDDNMKTKNYTDLEIVSAQIPGNTHDLIENTEYDILLVISGKILYTSPDKADNWTSKDGDGANENCYAPYHDRTNDKIYYVRHRNLDFDQIKYIDLTDLSVNVEITSAAFQFTDTIMDLVTYNSKWYVLREAYNSGLPLTTNINILNFSDDVSEAVSYASPAATSARVTKIIVVGDMFFMVVWDDDTDAARLYKYDVGDDAWTLLQTAAAGIQVPSSISQRGISYDGSDILQFILYDSGDSKNYLYSYSIGGDILTKKGEYNIALMLDRNTDSGIQEKAFHLTEYKVYELHEQTSKVHLIAVPDTGEVIVGITDNLFITTGGDMWEYEDVTAYVSKAEINMKDRGASSALFSLLDTYTLEEGMFITITDMFTTATVSTEDSIIFEGFVENFIGRRIQDAVLISPALKDLDEEFPSGDYSGRTDEIISTIITDKADYMTAGTMSAGIAMGTITFGGDKSVREILDEFALTDGFTWYLTPTGVLLYNAGTVDSGENFTENSKIWNVNKHFGERAVNYVDIKGAFVDGVQVIGTPAQDIPDQQVNGRIPFERTFSHLDLAAQCTTTNTNVLTRYGTQALLVPFSHQDSTVGVIQPCETVTFQYNRTDPNIASTQMGIRNVRYDAKQGKAHYETSDRIL